MRLLVTGCHGFVGASVGSFASQRGWDVFGIGLTALPPSRWRGRYQQTDVAHSDLAPLVQQFAPDLVLHAAGTASVGLSFDAPLHDLRSAVLTWANLLDGLRRSGIRPLVVFPSSAAVYGNPAHLPVSEDSATAPISPYGFHKSACELLAREYCECFGLDVCVLRLFSTYGPRQKRLLIWELFAQAIGEDPEVIVSGSGQEVRDYLHIDDVAHISLKIFEKRPRGFSLFNVGSGEGMRILDLAGLMVRLTGVNKAIRTRGEGRAGDPLCWQADVQRLRTIGAYVHRPICDGIRDCLQVWRCA